MNDIETPMLQQPISLHWNNVEYAVPQEQTTKVILENSWGEAPRGRVTAILGSSGAGKTTLINILTGRIQPSNMVLYVNHTRVIDVTRTMKRARCAFVEQEDCLWASSTTFEALFFSARMRLPARTSDQECKTLVHSTLQKLGLSHCADTMIGDPLVDRGLSGGERKRVSIGIELIAEPRLLFLDEPTSGLDSQRAAELVQVLKSLADKDGVTVVTTIHQPSSHIFFSFDHIIIMKTGGKTAYCGPPTELVEFLKSRGFPIPNNYNPADFVLGIVNQLPPAEDVEFEVNVMVRDDVNEDENTDKTIMASSYGKKINVMAKMMLLTRRELQGVVRNKTTLRARIGMVFGIGLVLGAVMHGSGKPSDKVLDVQTHFACLTLLTTSTMISMSNPIALTFPMEKVTLIRESLGGFYGVPTYFWSKFAVEIITCLVQTVIMLAIIYPTVQLQGDIVELFLILFGLGLVASSVGLLISAAADSVKTAVSLNPVLIVPQLLFAGFVVPIAAIPSYLKIFTYVSQIRWAIALLVVSEFQNDPGGQYVLQENEIDKDNWPWYALILVANFLVFRLAAMFVLKRKMNGVGKFSA